MVETIEVTREDSYEVEQLASRCGEAPRVGAEGRWVVDWVLSAQLDLDAWDLGCHA